MNRYGLYCGSPAQLFSCKIIKIDLHVFSADFVDEVNCAQCNCRINTKYTNQNELGILGYECICAWICNKGQMK